MGFTKKELIEKLKSISSLYDDVVEIEEELEEFEPEDIYEREVILPKFPGKYNSEEERRAWKDSIEHEYEDAVETMDKIYDRVYKPKQPQKPIIGSKPVNEANLTNDYKKNKGCLPVGALILAALSLLSGGLFSKDPLTVVLNVIIILICGIVIFLFYKKYKGYVAADEEVTRIAISSYELEKKEKEENYVRDKKKYQMDISFYEQAKANFIKEYIEWRETYIKHLKEEEDIEEKLEKDKVVGARKIYQDRYIPAKNKLDELNDLISDEYLPVIDDIINLLESNRADGLKEAINLYEEIAYRERQLELQREIEEQRMYEEELRRQEEARRYQQEIEYREEQERQRRYEEERREREAERRHKEELALQERQERDRQIEERRQMERERRKQNREEFSRKMDEERATFRQCNTCALTERCSMAFRRSNCANYRPR